MLLLILFLMVLICLFISQPTFVVMTISVVRITNASLLVFAVMLTSSVEMDQMRKIAVVRMFLTFPYFVMFILCVYEYRIYSITTCEQVTVCFYFYHLRTMSDYQLQNHVLKHFVNNNVTNDVLP